MVRPLAIVFDFDGVLADTEPLHLCATRQVLAEIGVELTDSDYYGRYLGYDDPTMFTRIGIDCGLDVSDRQRAELAQRKADLMPGLLSQPGVLFPSAASCVRRLSRDVPLAIASGALRREIELVIDVAGLRHCFDCIVAGGDTPQGKPSPDPYVRALSLLRRAGRLPADDDAAGRSVAIEDSLHGLASARAAGLRCVAVTTSYPADRLASADLVVADLASLDLDALSALIARA